MTCDIQFHAGEGDVKRAMRSVGKMLRFWGGGGDVVEAPDLFDADITDAHGQVTSRPHPCSHVPAPPHRCHTFPLRLVY